MKLLVANRGEIALRIFRACRDLGIRTVAVFSDADRISRHVAEADEAVGIGPAPPQESYLSIARILQAARKTGARLIHPGYGFLAESADFARACGEAGLVFVGPPASAIAAMGLKTESRRRLRQAGVPVVPGMDRAGSLAQVRAFAEEAGYPILLKASAGGGGKGMRVVRAEKELTASYERARSEAEAFFGDPAVYAEKLVEEARHVEVQVVADSRGEALAVGERECSLQRRHQKVVEECPSPVVDPPLRKTLTEAALAAVRGIGYVSCGTVEFLLAPDRRHYFLEMNTRLQVEHPVTEEVWGVDLAREMISIALGEPLSFREGDLQRRGHAIECRIYAEDPDRNFAPSPGTIASFRLPEGPGVRNDVGVGEGSLVPVEYDPMLGKLIVWGRSRREAMERLGRALDEYEVAGVATTVPLFRDLVADEDFRTARFHTQWLDGWLARRQRRPSEAGVEEAIFAAACVAIQEAEKWTGAPPPARSRWRQAAREAVVRRKRP